MRAGRKEFMTRLHQKSASEFFGQEMLTFSEGGEYSVNL